MSHESIEPNKVVHSTPSRTEINIISQDERPSSYKRTAEELFGDIDDINFESIQLPIKKQKTEEENDMDLINKIIEGRRIRQMLNEPSNRIQIDTEPSYKMKDNLCLNIPRLV